MFNVEKLLKSVLSTGAIIGMCLSYSSIANAETTAEEAANEAVVARILKVKGTPDYRAVAREVFAADHKVLRNEFENLIYNADDPVLKPASEPDFQAITERTNTIERIFGDGDLVAAMLRVEGKHTGNLYGIPATGKSFDIITTAVFRLADGKITESWYLSEEAGLLQDLGVSLPKRVDGRANLPPVYDDVRTFDEGLAEHLATSPRNTAEWHNKTLLLSYKSQPENRAVNWGQGRPYSNRQRGGIDDIIRRANVLGVEGSHGASMSGRRDMIGYALANENQGMIAFRLTAKNSGPLYGIPPSGHDLHDWEIGFARFDGPGNWTDAWWMADELGFVLTVGGQDGSPESLNFYGQQ
jgi:hypothetical protein